MALNDLKQTNAEINQYGVISAPDKMTGSAAENKAVFDRLFRQVGAEKFNQLIDELQASGAAAQIGIATVAGLTGATTVQEAVEKIVGLLREMTQGAVADGSITEEKMADDSVSNRALRPASVGADNYMDGSITEPKYADASIPERAFQSETVGGETLKQKSVTTKHYADRSIGNDQLDDLCVGERNVMAGAVGTTAVKDGSIARSKLAMDALYSPIVGPAYTHTFNPADCGKTFVTQNSEEDYEFRVNNDKNIPLGTEIAIATVWMKSCRIVFGANVIASIPGNSWVVSPNFIIPEVGTMVALKKLFSWDDGNEMWLITGNVEVV